MCKITDSYCSPPVSPSPAYGRGGNKAIVVLETTSSSNERRVRFGSDVEHVFEKDFTEADMRHIWYNGEEFMAMKNEIYAMFRSLHTSSSSRTGATSSSNNHKRPQHELHSDNNDNDNHWNWRGFEHVRQKRPRKEIRRKFVSDLVYFQKRVTSDPEGLGLYAVTNSRGALERARHLAKLDEFEAFEIYQETEVDPEWSNISLSDEDDSTTCSETTTSTTEESETEKESSESSSSSSGEQQPLLQLESNPVAMSMCRLNNDNEEEADSKTVRLLPDNNVTPRPQEKEALSKLMITPLKLAHILFPCIC